MTQHAGALRPLWWLTTGVVASTAVVASLNQPGNRWLPLAMIALTLSAAVPALKNPRRRSLWFLLTGLGLGASVGLVARSQELQASQTLASVEDAAVRASITVDDGWSRSRWGYRAQVTVHSASWRGAPIAVSRRSTLEVRSQEPTRELPAPGTSVNALVRVVARGGRPLLIASSWRLLETTRPPGGLPAVRDRLQSALFQAAGTDVRRIRSAELAAALVVGRRDLIPPERRAGWRRSGLAHLLAVSGLHVGLVAAALWFLTRLVRLQPTASRLVVLSILPIYTLLSGASPSSIRATAMVALYLSARLLGRALLPMAAVLTAAAVMLSFDPGLIVQPGFQLTVGVTAALVRWTGPVADLLRGPGWLRTAIALPVVAQIAAAPIIAWHFRSLVPAAVLSNLLVPFLLAPTLIAAGLATFMAVLWPALAGPLLDLTALFQDGLWWAGQWGRATVLITPSLPIFSIPVLAVLAWVALGLSRHAKTAAGAWLTISALALMLWNYPASTAQPTVTLLPIADGLAATIADDHDVLLIDGGRWQRQTIELLAEQRQLDLSAVVASHPDDDHIGGLAAVLGSASCEKLIMPAWMTREMAAVPLLRAARRHGVDIVPVARGNRVRVGNLVFETLWPPARTSPSTTDNERSLVARVRFESGDVALITSDVGHPTERHLLKGTNLGCDVLVVGHHGSRHSTSPEFLTATDPMVALIPAGSLNNHGHPHPEVVSRLQNFPTKVRSPNIDGLCGARLEEGHWQVFPAR